MRLSLITAVTRDTLNIISSDPVSLTPGTNNPGGVEFQYSVDDGVTFYLLSGNTMTWDGTLGERRRSLTSSESHRFTTPTPHDQLVATLRCCSMC